MAACMSAVRRSRLFGDLATYCRINAARTIWKRDKADIPKLKYNKDKQGNKVGVCVMPFPRVLDIDPAVEEACQNPLRDLKYHRGIMTAKTVGLPDLLTYNARLLLAEKQLLSNTVLARDVQRLHNVLKCRQPPMEKKVINKDLQQIFESNYATVLQSGVVPDALDPRLKKQIERKSLDSFYKTHHRWSKMELSANTCLTYMAARLAPNFRVLYQIFHEIHKRDDSFKPTSIYNLGSGLGTVVWAADAIWNKKVFEYYNVDESAEMNELAKKLLSYDMNTMGSSIKGVNFRQFPLSDDANASSFKMVVSAYTLMEQPNRLARLHLVDSLWRLADDYLVLVEHGTTAGHRLMMEARDFILKNQAKYNKSEPECHVFAPCTHEKKCPKLELHKTPCYFTTEFRPLNTGKEYGQGLRNATDMYTYLVMKKGARQDVGHSYPRVLNIIKKHAFSECEMCCRDGTMRNYAVSKSKPSKMVHLAVRKCDSGDFLPVNWPSEEEMKEYEFDPSPPKEKKYKRFRGEALDTAQAAADSDNVSDETKELSQETEENLHDMGAHMHGVEEGIHKVNVDSHGKVLNDGDNDMFELRFEDFEEKGNLIDDDDDDDFDAGYDSNVDNDDRSSAETLTDTDSKKTFKELIQEAENKKNITKRP